MSITEIVGYLIGEGRVIRDAPVAFLVSVAFIALLIWLALSFKFQIQLDNKSSQIELLERQVADYKDKLNGASPSQVKEQIDQLEQKIKLLESRHLTDDQKRIITEQCRLPFGVTYRIDIKEDVRCRDCNDYAGEFSSIFNQIKNWTVRTPLVMGPGQADPSGITVILRDAANPTAQDTIVMRALHMAQLKFGVAQGEMIGTDIELQITAKRD